MALSRRRFFFFLPSLAVIVSPQRSLRCLLSKLGGRSGRTVKARVPILNPYFQLSRSSCNVYSPAGAAAHTQGHSGANALTRRKNEKPPVSRQLLCAKAFELRSEKCQVQIFILFLFFWQCQAAKWWAWQVLAVAQKYKAIQEAFD